MCGRPAVDVAQIDAAAVAAGAAAAMTTGSQPPPLTPPPPSPALTFRVLWLSLCELSVFWVTVVLPPSPVL